MERSVSVPGEAKHAFDRQDHDHDMHLQASLMDLAYDAIIVRDPESRVVSWNRGAEQLYGWSAQEAIGQVTHELLRTRFPESREALDRFLVSGELWQGKLVHTCKDGTQVLVESRQTIRRNAGGELLAILEINRDITERQQREREQLERYHTIVSTANEGIWLIDMQARTLFINPRMAGMLGYAVEEIDSHPVSEFVFPEDVPKAQEWIGNNLQGTLEQFDFRFRRKGGRPLDVLACTSPVRDGTGRISGALGMFTDVTERKQAEVDQLRLAAIVKSSDDAIVSKTLDGIITSWNLAAERMFGYTSQEAVGQHITLIIPLELRAEEEMILAKLRKGEHIDHFETVRMRKDGSRLDISLTISPIKNSAGQIIGASKIARDITESKRLRRDLEFLADASKVLSSSLDYRATLQAIARLAVPHVADWCAIEVLDEGGALEPLAIAHVDPHKVQWAEELRKKYPVNMEAAHGIPQVLRTGNSELIPIVSNDLLLATAVDDEHLQVLRALGFTSGMIVPLLIDGKAEGTLTFALAESSRHYTQADLIMVEELASRASLAIQNARLYQAVQQSRDQLDIILQGVADGIVVYAPDSHIIYANEAIARMSGYSSAEHMLAEQQRMLFSRYELIDEQGRPFPHTRLPYLRVFVGEPEVQAVIGLREVGSGQPERWSLVTSRPVSGPSGEVALVVTIVHDITERLLVERRKDAFIGMASHELKTPVTSLKGFTNILQRHLTRQGDAQGLHYLARMDAQIDRLTALISELLDISRMQSGNLVMREETVALDALIEETVEAEQAASATHRLLIEGNTGVQVVGDQERLRQVFVNLLTNAIKYSQRAEKVIVRLVRDDGSRQATVSVQDFGIGIDQAHHEQIFERFYQVAEAEEKTYPGLGIGLYISREIVKRHRGRLWVESSKGNGATFFVALPFHSPDEQADQG